LGQDSPVDPTGDVTGKGGTPAHVQRPAHQRRQFSRPERGAAAGTELCLPQPQAGTGRKTPSSSGSPAAASWAAGKAAKNAPPVPVILRSGSRVRAGATASASRGYFDTAVAARSLP